MRCALTRCAPGATQGNLGGHQGDPKDTPKRLRSEVACLIVFLNFARNFVEWFGLSVIDSTKGPAILGRQSFTFGFMLDNGPDLWLNVTERRFFGNVPDEVRLQLSRAAAEECSGP